MQRQGALREPRGSLPTRMVRTGTMLGPPGTMSAVEIKIADKYCAPGPTSMPMGLSSMLQSPLDMMPKYCFDLETDVLRRADNRRRAEDAERRRSLEQAAETARRAPVPMATIMSSGILEPERPGAAQPSTQDDRDQSNPANWSLRDFEAQASDPFEMAELKTIDVMAELSTVFPTQQAADGAATSPSGGHSPSPQPVAGATPSVSPTNGFPATMAAPPTTLASATPAVGSLSDSRQQPQAADVRPIPRTRASVTAPGAGAGQNGGATTAALNVPPRSLHTDSAGGGGSTSPQLTTSPHANAAGAAAGGPTPSARPRPKPRAPATHSDVPLPSPTGSTATPAASSSSTVARPRRSVPQPPQAAATAAQSSSSVARPVPAMAMNATGAPPPVAQPVSAGGAPQGPPPAYSSAVAAPPPTGDAFPPPYPMQPPQQQGSGSNSDTRLPARVAPPPPYMATNGDAASGITAAGYIHSDYSLPDVFAQLKKQEKKLVDQLKQMGFPRDRLSRAVQRLGGDQAKVLEFMFQINKFGEPPHHFPPDSAETALINNDLSEEKAMACLKLVFELREMGFQEAVIHKALQETKNNRDEAVDYLISNA